MLRVYGSIADHPDLRLVLLAAGTGGDLAAQAGALKAATEQSSTALMAWLDKTAARQISA